MGLAGHRLEYNCKSHVTMDDNRAQPHFPNYQLMLHFCFFLPFQFTLIFEETANFTFVAVCDLHSLFFVARLSNSLLATD